MIDPLLVPPFLTRAADGILGWPFLSAAGPAGRRQRTAAWSAATSEPNCPGRSAM